MQKPSSLRATGILIVLATLSMSVASGCVWGVRHPVKSERGGIVGGPALRAYLDARGEAQIDPSAVYRPWVILLPFEDQSGFRSGVFELSTDVPNMLGTILEESQACRIVPPEVAAELIAGRDAEWSEAFQTQLSDSLRADYVISGVLTDYNFERLHVGDPLLGGYKSWEGTAELEVRLAGGGLRHQSQARHVTQNRGIGLDLLGKPREQDLHYVRLEEMEYGGPEFLQTALGEATQNMMRQITSELVEILQPRRLVGVDTMPTVLSVSGGEVFIDVGIDHGVRRGYRFTVDPSDTRPAVADDEAAVVGDDEAAVVEVQEVISAGVSRATLLRGHAAAGQRLRLIISAEDETPTGAGGT
ncbi:MAG: hypothetical protein HOC05_25370 [Gemmatimonadetes bacterium]|nr:hypothetical protein [Gemmatimonadota bacterium]